MARLREITRVSQDEPGILRRWFTDNDYWDLYVWTKEETGKVIGFQLCYNKEINEKALTWIEGKEFTHKTVNPGDNFENRNRMGTPILVPDGYFQKESICDKFLEDSENIESRLRKLVSEKIMLFENEDSQDSV